MSCVASDVVARFSHYGRLHVKMDRAAHLHHHIANLQTIHTIEVSLIVLQRRKMNFWFYSFLSKENLSFTQCVLRGRNLDTKDQCSHFGAQGCKRIVAFF